MNELFNVGIDIGSTTVKSIVLDKHDKIVYEEYKRHFSDIKKSVRELLSNIYIELGNCKITIVITGSGGIELSKKLNVKFIQEVISSTKAIEYFNPNTDVVIELGGEDAKITYINGGIDQRMNGICAGGTGSFIDQMASLLETDAIGLNKLAKDYKVIYPIASRCGVFAKTDIQPLINDGAQKSDIAMSIFNAVAVQTISVLACGRKIKGRIAFLGGPLFFLSQLRLAFKNLLNLKDEDMIIPNNAQLYIAIGASLLSRNEKEIEIEYLIENLNSIDDENFDNINNLEPLFKNKDDYENFKLRHSLNNILYKDIREHIGSSFLGIDTGSTSTKAVLIDEEGKILYSYYNSNRGNPLETIKDVLCDIYNKLPENSKIVFSTITGYGEGLIKKALKIDFGEIETIAHYKGAKYFNKDVDFILDIGGQDMKCLKIKNGIIDNIILNEACSSGCGSFLENFASSLSMNIKDFADIGIYSKKPVDLGSRCTVFMNSRVKQAQKEGASISDISAGLSYSVIKNALYKVIKIKDINEIGKNIVVQGGTFYNDLVLRSFEKLIGREVIRPSISGIMGAYGAALISKEKYEEGYMTKILDKEQLKDVNIDVSVKRCTGCNNKCLLTINKFLDDDIYISGNRCEIGGSIYDKKSNNCENDKINIFKFKQERLFKYIPLPKEKAFRGNIGIPRVLNIYEDYPFWFTFLTQLGFRVILSDRTSKSMYEKGIVSIASETVCYPGKLVHGHIMNLIEKDMNIIFYPSITNETKEDNTADNHYNCPVVISYSEVIKNNVDEIKENNITYINPFISLNNKEKLKNRLYQEFKKFFNDISIKNIGKAVEMATIEQESFKRDIQLEGEKCLLEIKKDNLKGIVLCGRPYHLDPEINHGIPELINSLGMAVLTEDSICHLSELERPLRVVDQWVYHSRLYKAAQVVKDIENLELVQLNSFGCGIDAVTIDQVQEILEQNSKMYTVIKIDEGNNLGAAKIRLRSLKSAILERKLNNNTNSKTNPIIYKKGILSKKNTILAPQMSPIHFQFFEESIRLSGYNIEVLDDNSSSIVEEGLKYVNNDACYPAILVVGQIISALKTMKYDLNNTSVVITQTGGGCRATNYIGFLRKALYDSGFENIPVISLSVNGIEKNGLIKNITLNLVNRLLMSAVYGDLLMKVVYRVRPYEKIAGSTNSLYNKWANICKNSLKQATIVKYLYNIRGIVNDFDNLEIVDIKKPKIGLVGEILVKFHPVANNNLVDLIEKEGGEAVVPELINFFMSCALNTITKYKYLEGKLSSRVFGEGTIAIINYYLLTYRNELRNSKRFKEPHSIRTLAKNTSPVVSICNQTGEGWLLTGEMIELINDGINNIICMQPFGCLPNHITGKGTIKELKRINSNANIIPIDYDPSASETNQLNRIKLMLSNAFKNIKSM